MDGKWLIADRDLNEREGLKWLLKSSSLPVKDIFLASTFQEFVVLFEKETPDIVFLELDMIRKEDWSSFRQLMQIYHPILLLSSAEATFERARLAIDLQALDLMIKPFSAAKIKSAFQKSIHRLERHVPYRQTNKNSYKDLSYESLFISESALTNEYDIAAVKTESMNMVDTLYSFLSDYPFHELQGIFPLSDMVILLFEDTCQTIKIQCQKTIRKWEEEFSDPLAIVIHSGRNSTTLHHKYKETRKMMEITYYKGYRQVVEFPHSFDWVHIDPFLTPPEQRLWVDMLTNGDLANIKKWLYEEFLQQQEPFPDPGLVRIRLTSILAQMRRYMKTYQLDGQQTYEREYRYIFNSILYDTVLYRTVQNLILFTQKLFLGAASSSKNAAQDPIERAISYLNVNFSKSDLRLEEVAQYVDRNPSYFSHLLISKTGTSFTEILTRIRIREAKRYLVETNKPIKEISSLAGFHNANYFSRIFKEAVGASPREFRMNKGVIMKDEKTQ